MGREDALNLSLPACGEVARPSGVTEGGGCGNAALCGAWPPPPRCARHLPRTRGGIEDAAHFAAIVPSRDIRLATRAGGSGAGAGVLRGRRRRWCRSASAPICDCWRASRPAYSMGRRRARRRCCRSTELFQSGFRRRLPRSSSRCRRCRSKAVARREDRGALADHRLAAHTAVAAPGPDVRPAAPHAIEALALSLLSGTPSVSALGAIGAGLTLSIRRGGLILPLLVLPLLAPAVIFGLAARGAERCWTACRTARLLLLAAFSVAVTLRIALRGRGRRCGSTSQDDPHACCRHRPRSLDRNRWPACSPSPIPSASWT